MNIKSVVSIGVAVIAGAFLTGLAVGALTQKKCSCKEKDVKTKQDWAGVPGQGKTEAMCDELEYDQMHGMYGTEFPDYVEPVEKSGAISEETEPEEI